MVSPSRIVNIVLGRQQAIFPNGLLVENQKENLQRPYRHFQTDSSLRIRRKLCIGATDDD
jgi:hypothetical protein